MEYPEVRVTIRREHKRGKPGRFVIRVSGITSGYTTHVADVDNSEIEFKFDHNRFRPRIVMDEKVILDTRGW